MQSYNHPEKAVMTVCNEVVHENILIITKIVMMTKYVIKTGKKTIFEERPL